MYITCVDHPLNTTFKCHYLLKYQLYEILTSEKKNEFPNLKFSNSF